MNGVLINKPTLNESIYFDYAPTPTYAGHINRYPFRVVITSLNDNPHIVTLDSKYSKSYKPQKDKSKWSFLRPEVRFLDLDFNEIDYIVTKDTKLYLDSTNNVTTVSTNNFIGVSGYGDFYFVDDLYNYDLAIKNKKYSTIIAILQTSGIDFFDKNFGIPRFQNSFHIENTEGSNSLAIAKQPHIFLYRDPDYIKISETGQRDFINPRWVPVPQNVVFNFDWDSDSQKQIYGGNGLLPYTFNKNLPSNTNTQVINISCFGDILKPYFPEDIKIKYKDENDYISPGFCKTYFNVATSSQTVLTLSAICTFASPNVEGMFINNKIWLSNPNAGQMNLLEYNNPKYIFNENEGMLKANIFCFNVPLVPINNKKVGNLYQDPFAFTGYHSIDSIAPLPQPYTQAWGVESDAGILYKFDSNGLILSAIDLLSVYYKAAPSFGLPNPIVNNQLSPKSVVLDSKLNLWITLYDNKYVIHIDSITGEIIDVLDISSSILEYEIPNINSNWYNANQPVINATSDSQNFIEPTFVDVDSYDRIWVTYSNYASGYLTKFDSRNNVYVNITYPLCSCPQDLIIDNEDNVWVALSNNIWNSLGKIEKRDTNGNLLSSFGNYMGVNNLCLDLNQNLWFTYDYANIGRIDKNGQVYKFSIYSNLTNSELNPHPPYFSNDTPPKTVFDASKPKIGFTDMKKNTDETILEGIFCDQRGFLYVINSIANEVLVYDTESDPIYFIDQFYVNPKGFSFWTDIQFNQTTKISNNFWNKSLQAHGDPTGLKWYNKFLKLTTYTKTVTGKSTPLKFYNIPSRTLSNRYAFLATTFYQFIHTNFQQKIKVSPRRDISKDVGSFNLDFFKINENFDLAAYIKNFAITPTLYNSQFLFEKFLPSIYGTFPYYHSDLGISVYEKISNFIINNSDIDTCDIKSVDNLSKMINYDSNNYTISYPNEIKRIIDTVSTNVCHFIGSENQNQNYFGIKNKNNKSNIGNLLSTNYSVTAGIPIVLKTISLNKFEIINTGLLYNQFIYPLNELADFLNLNEKNTKWTDYYEFYEFKKLKSDEYKDSIIDWNNPQTTISRNITSVFDWNGDEQYLDSLFSYHLYKGLNIF
jgi:hypothetical protein